MKTAIYLTFNGNCRSAFAFYQKVFDVKPDWCMTNGDSPMKDKIPQSEHDKIMHTSINIKGMTLMGCDRNSVLHGGEDNKFVEGNNFQISLMPDSKKHADELYAALSSQGGKAGEPMQDMFWGSYWGSLTDAFGIHWMLDYQPPPLKTALKDKAQQLKTLSEELEAAADSIPEPDTKKAKTTEE